MKNGSPLKRAVRKIRTLIEAIGVAVIVGLIASLVFSSQIANFAVDRIFAHISIPEGREPPQTAYAIPTVSTDIQMLGGQGQGLNCSIPGFLEKLAFQKDAQRGPLSLQMRQACAMHDYCYRHGAATYGYSQEDCDYLLLEHGQRLCRFLRYGEKGFQDCGRDAKKVLFGVRLGGNTSFKRVDRAPDASGREAGEPVVWADDFQTSTYFEFDPYPVRSMKYAAFRIADAPRHCVAASGKPKALYVFTVRPAGLHVSIVTWASSTGTLCADYILPGWPERLTGAPNVLRQRLGDGGFEDWLVWWQRSGLEKTGGRFVGVAPGRAMENDWKMIFPGASEIKKGGFSEADGCETCLEAGMRPSIKADRRRSFFITKTGKGGTDDNNASEYHPAPGLEAEFGLRLMAVRVHSCVTERSGANTLCLSDLVIDPGGPRKQGHEPLTVRDDWNDGGLGNESKRYRNFAMPPIAIAGVDKQPVLAWFRRGDAADGSNYSKTALMRRGACAPNDEICDQRNNIDATGRNMGSLRLLNFKEEDEPVVVFGRTQDTPNLVSIRADPAPSWYEFWGKRNGVHFSRWRLEPPIEMNKPYDPPVDVPKMDVGGECGKDLDASWLVRTPVVLAREDGTGTVLFSRALHVSTAPNLQLEIQQVAIDKDMICKQVNRLVRDSGIRVDTEHTEIAVSKLRQRPILIMTDESYRRADIVLADPLKPEESIILIEAIDLHE